MNMNNSYVCFEFSLCFLLIIPYALTQCSDVARRRYRSFHKRRSPFSATRWPFGAPDAICVAPIRATAPADASVPANLDSCWAVP